MDGYSKNEKMLFLHILNKKLPGQFLDDTIRSKNLSRHKNDAVLKKRIRFTMLYETFMKKDIKRSLEFYLNIC